jgi:hypothetical protein
MATIIKNRLTCYLSACLPACLLSITKYIFSLGLAMDFIKKENGCQHFSFVHSSQYQTIQFEFLDAVESFNPDNIAVNQSHHTSLNIT